MQTSTHLAPFDYDVDEAREHFDAHGWFHAPAGANKEFLSVVTEQIKALTGQGDDLADWRYPEKKQQFLWDLPAGLDASSLCAAVAAATGMNPETTVIAERHLKLYSSTAPEMPPAHKDRGASMVTVGVGIDIPVDSRLVMWPHDHLEVNPFPTSAEWRETRDADELPEVVLGNIAPDELDLRRGDVVMFKGSVIYHERHLPANTSVLYLKFNDASLDPLGEDPRTVAAEEISNELTANGFPTTGALKVSPRVIGLRTDELFPESEPQFYVRMFGHEPGIRISPTEAQMVRTMASSGELQVEGLDAGQRDGAERLARLGAVILG